MTSTLSLSELADAYRLAAFSTPAPAAAPVEEYHFAGFRLLPYRRLLMKAGERVAIGSRAFALLLKLVENAGTMVSKPDLLRAGWSRPHVEESNLRVQICTLKRVLSRLDDTNGLPEELIVSIAGEGYVFTAAVTARSEVVPTVKAARQTHIPELAGLMLAPLAAAPAPPRSQETRWPVTFSCPYPQPGFAFS
ncbi:winged helix-turn-helix domain-containing protein [Radicibacter daui]|uniref:winged helix-turn-helix domain-containing protein n=1 Tax=Radicibacter daui TaxID=3064829 RepID=UPI004046E0B3